MAKRFYLATRKDRGEEAAELLEALKSRGWERTFTWTPQNEANTNGYSEVALKELAGVQQADVLIVMLPGGFGTHVEIGAALVLCKPVILHAPDQKTLETPYPCIFHHHPLVTLLISEVPDVGSLLACVEAVGNNASE